MQGGLFTILTLVAIGAAVTIALIFLADARDWRRMRERMRHQRALADVEACGDFPLLPEGLRGPARKAGGRPGVEPAQGFARHSHHDAEAPTR